MKKLLLVLLLSLAASFGFAQTRQAGTVAVVNSDFWRSTAGALPDGVIDTTEAIVHNGQVVIDTGSAADSGLTLPQLTTTVAPTVGAAAIGVTATGKVVRYTAPAFDSTVDFSTATPTSAGVVFTPNTPALTTVLYVSAVNGSQWTYNGTAYVSAPVLPSWQTTGNAGTVEANNFIGTTDNVGFSLRTRNQIRQTISPIGQIGFGMPVPVSQISLRGGTSDFGFYSNGLSTNQGKMAVLKAIETSDGGGHLAFETYRGGFGGGERMRLTNEGGLSIGSPLVGGKLHLSLASSNASPAIWNNSHAVFGNGGGPNASGLGIGYDNSTNEAWIGTMAPNVSWRPLRFHGTSWKFVSTGTIEAFTIAPNSSVGVNVSNPVQKLEVGGNIRVTGVVNYASTAAAVADAGLLPGVFYSVTTAGVKQLYLK